MLWPLFPPSVRSGGPARSAEGMLSALAHEFEFSVITSAFDYQDSSPMDGVTPDRWCDTFGAKTWYMSDRRPRPLRVLHLIRGRDPQLVYFNSLWHPRFSILPLLVLCASRARVPVLIAPRGELSEGALRIRPLRKRFMILVYRALRIARTVAWHASTEMELADIRRVFGPKLITHVAVAMRADLGSAHHQSCKGSKQGGRVRAVFLSRITPKKNLDGLLRAISLVTVPLELTIAGPIDDWEYWSTCEQLIEALPSSARIKVNGAVAPATVVKFLSDFDLFVLPTHGENYGHAILEALAAGLPVIVGRNTPWKQVEEERAGWLVDSASPTALARLIERFVALTPAERASFGESAARLACKVQEDGGGVEAHRRMFLEVLQAKPGQHDHEGGRSSGKEFPLSPFLALSQPEVAWWHA